MLKLGAALSSGARGPPRGGNFEGSSSEGTRDDKGAGNQHFKGKADMLKANLEKLIEQKKAQKAAQKLASKEGAQKPTNKLRELMLAGLEHEAAKKAGDDGILGD